MLRPFAAAPLALLSLAGAPLALAQDNPETVGVSVAGTLVEVPADVAAQACGVDAQTLLAEWNALPTELSTMADTSVQADATDLAPEVAVDTPMDSAIDGQTAADGADATATTDGTETAAAPDVASDVNTGADASSTSGDTSENVTGVQSTAADTEPGSTPEVPSDGTMDAGVEPTTTAGTADDPATADAATGTEVASAGTGQDATTPATPTEGTTLSKSAVCDVSQDTADQLGIQVPG